MQHRRRLLGTKGCKHAYAEYSLIMTEPSQQIQGKRLIVNIQNGLSLPFDTSQTLPIVGLS